ncbi:MAG: hypothetical protein IPO21_19590 [Bacteroidales bacterium]|nr:hypothetical protein [Bacteroidales bacterium]
MQTDGAGNPLTDVLLGANDAAKAFDDLWFILTQFCNGSRGLITTN